MPRFELLFEVLAKGEADAMQYTLPLKQKQIEQSKLEAEARKEATSGLR